MAKNKRKASKATLFSKNRAIKRFSFNPSRGMAYATLPGRVKEIHKHEMYSFESSAAAAAAAAASGGVDSTYNMPSHQLGEIYKHFYSSQIDFRAYPYMSKQEAVNAKMRAILVDWLAEVHHKFKLQPISLWLTVNILDRYLGKESVQRVKLQLVGVTALFLACKCFNSEDGASPSAHQSVYITDYAYKQPEVVETEIKLLEVLEFRVFVPTGYNFLERYLQVVKPPTLVRNLAWFYAERNLQEYDSLTLTPHHFAAAALYGALVYISQYGSDECDPPRESVWPPILEYESGLKESAIIPAARQVLMHVNESPSTSKSRKLNAIWKKYVGDKYCNVAQLPLPSV
jgi:cyclin B